MSGRYDYGKGSSRSRDDSRQERRRERDRSRSPRSRSPRRQRSPEASSNRYSKERAREPDTTYDKDGIPKPDKILKHTEWDESSEDEVPAPPPPPRISKISMGFTKPSAPIKMSLGGKAGAAPKPTIASVFNADDDDEPEEMPAEARMRMRNIGRETPTSAGPNSFGKTKQGFCDAKKLFEKNLKQQLETNEKPALSKFPQTIYKIKPT